MRYTYVRQHDSTDCAAAALAMVCLHYKKEITITRLRDMMGTDLKGTNLIGLQKAAEELGFNTAAVRVDRDSFLSDFSLPCIAQVITKQGLTHFVVVFKKTTIRDDDKRAAHIQQEQEAAAHGKKKKKSRDYVVIGDPGDELKRITVDEFYETFTGVLLLLTPNSSFTPGKVKQGSMFRRYVDLLMPQKKLFFYTILASVILTILGIVSSVFNKVLMDEILPYGLRNVFVTYLLVFTSVSIISEAVSFVRSWIMYYLSIKIDIPLMLGYFGHIYKLPMKFFATRKTGDIITRFSDAGNIKSIFTSIALSLVMDIVMAVGTGFVLYRMNASLFSVILFSTIVSFFLVLIFRQPFKRINEETMQQSSIMNSEIIEGLRAVETIKGNAVEDVEMENIEREYIKSIRIGYRSTLLSSTQGVVSSLVSMLFNTIMTYVGITQVLEGTLSLGSYMAFTTLAGYFTSPISNLISLQYSIQECTISMKRLTEIMDHELEQPADQTFNELESIDGDVEFKNVTFRYGTRNPVLKNVSFTIPKGKKVALVGGSGSGKSTTVKLLLKYYEPEEGMITLDGVDMREYSNKSIREAIAYVPQNIELFSKSILDNIRIAKRGATLDEVREAARKADAHDFIRKLPMQYNTFLEEAGNGLSGGEKQRIALARAFLKKSNFYILDESTSNLDFATENTIFDMIYNKLRDSSMLIVAHRLSTVRNCDKIIVLDQGEIVESGTHDELLARQGRYYELWNMQQGIIGSAPAARPAQPVPAAVIADDEDDDDDTLTY